jgi:hypothetical protein
MGAIAQLNLKFNNIQGFTWTPQRGHRYGDMLHLRNLAYGMMCLSWVGANQLAPRDIRDVMAPPISTYARKYYPIRERDAL